MPYVINGIDKSTIWLFRFFYHIYISKPPYNKKALTYTIEQTVRPGFNMDETIKNALEQWEGLKTKLLPAWIQAGSNFAFVLF